METSPAIMIRLPEVFGGKEARKLRSELKAKIGNGVPCVVVDLSRVKKIELDGVEGLLECMEEVANQDGSMELGAVSPEAAVILELTRLNQVLHMFPTIQASEESSPLVAERAGTREQMSRAPAVQPQPMVA